jgi:hypothetical protein
MGDDMRSRFFFKLLLWASAVSFVFWKPAYADDCTAAAAAVDSYANRAGQALAIVNSPGYKDNYEKLCTYGKSTALPLITKALNNFRRFSCPGIRPVIAQWEGALSDEKSTVDDFCRRAEASASISPTSCIETVPTSERHCTGNTGQTIRAINHCGKNLHIKLCIQKTTGKMDCGSDTINDGRWRDFWTCDGTLNVTVQILKY